MNYSSLSQIPPVCLPEDPEIAHANALQLLGKNTVMPYHMPGYDLITDL